MNKPNHRLKQAGSAHIIGAWLFLAAALVAGAIGGMRMMSSGAIDRAAGGADCLCVGVFFAVIAAVLALLGIHQQNTVLYDAIVPGYEGSHGSGDDSGGGE
jgi:hypothetical protein